MKSFIHIIHFRLLNMQKNTAQNTRILLEPLFINRSSSPALIVYHLSFNSNSVLLYGTNLFIGKRYIVKKVQC